MKIKALSIIHFGDFLEKKRNFITTKFRIYPYCTNELLSAVLC